MLNQKVPDVISDWKALEVALEEEKVKKERSTLYELIDYKIDRELQN